MERNALQALAEKASGKNIAMIQIPSDYTLAPLHDDEIIKPEEFEVPRQEQQIFQPRNAPYSASLNLWQAYSSATVWDALAFFDCELGPVGYPHNECGAVSLQANAVWTGQVPGGLPTALD